MVWRCLNNELKLVIWLILVIRFVNWIGGMVVVICFVNVIVVLVFVFLIVGICNFFVLMWVLF